MVATISTDIPATISVSAAERAIELHTIKDKLAAIARSGKVPDIIVIPEELDFVARYSATGGDPRSYLQSLFGSHEVLLIDSARVDGVGNTARERVIFFSSIFGTIATRNKYLLIPFGEFVPYSLAWALDAVGMHQEVAVAQASRTYLAGELPQPVSYHGADIIALVCSEMISPTMYYEATYGTHDPILINLSSQSDLHDSMNPYTELREMALVHSTWSNAPFYQSTNGAPEVRVGD
jgi:apolipoprotein N-acyltransferase